jgi:aminoglycoside phosphotransferase (APT) family kinase protein
MKNNIFKNNYERYENYINITPEQIKTLLKKHISQEIKIIESIKIGCANTNYKISYQEYAVILRIYTRDSKAMNREAKICSLVRDHIPVPQFLALDNSHTNISYSYAICSYMPGILMRDILLAHDSSAIIQCCQEAAGYLAYINTVKFAHGGFFQEDLAVTKFTQRYYDYFVNIISNKNIKNNLDKNLVNRIFNILEKNIKYLPDIANSNLVHGDFNPANIKIDLKNKVYTITGILDWEFAFSGSYLFDIASMLRYSHKMPDYYEESFISALKNMGFTSLKIIKDICYY